MNVARPALGRAFSLGAPPVARAALGDLGASSYSTTMEGIDLLNEAKLRARAKHYQKLQWATPLFTPKRVEYEKKANKFFKAADEAHMVRASPLIRLGRPSVLWTTPNSKRLVNFMGVINTPTGIQSDAINAIASGAQAGAGFLDGEHRKTILGALMALRQAGVPGISVKGLSAPMIGSPKVNMALTRAIGSPGKSLATASAHAVKRIAKYGPSMRALAWSNREMLWLQDVKGFETVHRTIGSISTMFEPIGVAVGAAIAVHSGITMAITKMLHDMAVRTAHENLAGARREVAAAMAKASATRGANMPPPSGASVDSSTLPAGSSTSPGGNMPSPTKTWTPPWYAPNMPAPRRIRGIKGAKASAGGSPGSFSPAPKASGKTWLIAGGIAAAVLGGAFMLSRKKGGKSVTVHHNRILIQKRHK